MKAGEEMCHFLMGQGPGDMIHWLIELETFNAYHHTQHSLDVMDC